MRGGATNISWKGNVVDGKKYKAKCTSNIYTVLWSDDQGAVMENAHGDRSWWWKADISGILTEYHEPVVIKGVRAVRLVEDRFSTTGIDYDWPSIVGKIEVTVTDGKLTDVRIV